MKINSHLTKLGLTVQQANIYSLLLNEGQLTAKKIAERLDILPNAVYRGLVRLDSLKLINLSSRAPLKYTIVSPEFSLSKLAKVKEFELANSLEMLIKSIMPQKSAKETDLGLSSDKLKFFKQSEDLINKARKEVLIISIGEPSTNELILADKRAIERGVDIKFIVHKYDDENRDFLFNLQKNGLNIRYLKDWGYHLQIIDANKCLLSVNNPENTDERANILIQSKYLSKAFRDYFYLLWEKAQNL